jgi:hypothetical protein
MPTKPERAVLAQLPEAVRSSLPWPRSLLQTVELPSNAHVPDGALQTGASERNMLMRSTCGTPLVEQAATLSTIAGVISTQSNAACENAAYLQTCFDLGFLHKNHKRFVRMHPADLVGLAVVGNLVQSQRGVLLMHAALEFCKWKQIMLRDLRTRFGDTVYISGFFEEHEFDVSSDEQRSALLSAVEHRQWDSIKLFICESLNVTRLPVLHDGSWCVALLPNIVGASDDDVADGVATFYELLKLREEQQQRGEALTTDDMANLASTLRGSSGGQRAFVDYLAAKWADRETRKTLSLTARRAKTLIGNFDQLVRGLRTKREAAYLKVAGKTIKRTGQEIKDLKRAAEDEMKRMAQKEKVGCRRPPSQPRSHTASLSHSLALMQPRSHAASLS